MGMADFWYTAMTGSSPQEEEANRLEIEKQKLAIKEAQDKADRERAAFGALSSFANKPEEKALTQVAEAPGSVLPTDLSGVAEIGPRTQENADTTEHGVLPYSTDYSKTLDAISKLPAAQRANSLLQYMDNPAVSGAVGVMEKQQAREDTQAAAKDLKNIALEEQKQRTQAQIDAENKRANESNATRLEIAALMGNQHKSDRELNLGQKEEQRTTDRLSKLSKDLDPSSMVRGAFSVSKQVIDRADRLRTLDAAVNAYQSGNADSRQIEELAIGMNSLLSGSNTGEQEQVKALIPKTAIGNATKMYEFLSGNPQGTNQQAFVARMMGTIQREKETAERQIKKTRLSRIAQYDDVRQKDPVGFNNVLQSWEIDPEEYSGWAEGGFKQTDVATGKVAGAPAAGGGASGTAKQTLAQQAINDPNATPEEKAQARKILGQ